MNLIEKFECEQKEIYGNGNQKILYKGICKIQTELIRPVIYIDNVPIIENAIIKGKFLYSNSYVTRKDVFTVEELYFLADKFTFEVIEKSGDAKILQAKITDNPKYSTPMLLWIYNPILEKEYMIIEASRWQFDYQPRSAGEDQLGEDITYIHGIWENVDLPQDILNKIKNETFEISSGFIVF